MASASLLLAMGRCAASAAGRRLGTRAIGMRMAVFEPQLRGLTSAVASRGAVHCKTPLAADRSRLFASSGGAFAISSAASPTLAETLERAREQALAMGFNPDEAYAPYLPVDFGQQVLLALHGALGDTGAAVAAAAILVRVGTLPWHQRSMKKQLDRIVLMPVYMSLAKALQQAQAQRGGTGVSDALGRAQSVERAEVDFVHLTAKLNDFNQSTHFNPVQGMGYQFLCMLPLHFLAYMSLRGIMGHPDSFRSLVGAPTLWVDSVVFADPLGVLPVLSAMAMLLNVEVNSPPPQPGQEENALYMKLVIRGAVLAFVPLTSLMPMALVLFMGTNALYTTVATWLFRRYCWEPPQVEARWHVDAPSTFGAVPLGHLGAPATPPPPPR